MLNIENELRQKFPNREVRKLHLNPEWDLAIDTSLIYRTLLRFGVSDDGEAYFIRYIPTVGEIFGELRGGLRNYVPWLKFAKKNFEFRTLRMSPYFIFIILLSLTGVGLVFTFPLILLDAIYDGIFRRFRLDRFLKKMGYKKLLKDPT